MSTLPDVVSPVRKNENTSLAPLLPRYTFQELPPMLTLEPDGGLFIWKSDYDLKAGSRSASVRVDGTDPVAGFGITFPAGYPNLKGRAGFDRYKVDSEAVNVFLLGLSYMF